MASADLISSIIEQIVRDWLRYARQDLVAVESNRCSSVFIRVLELGNNYDDDIRYHGGS